MEAVAAPSELGVAAAATVVPPADSRAVSTLAELEAALVSGLHEEWQRAVEADPLASLFQTSGWCMPWYRAYADAFDPYVIVVSAGGRTVGVVPMAVNRQTRELVFASHTMADYRDIVALPGYREQVVGELIRHYLGGRFAKTLQIGWIDPASDTPSLIAQICAQRGLRHTVRHQPCWRWFPPAPSKPSAQKFLNWYKRNGAVSFDVIDSEPAWEQFREEYYRQHTLRQIQTGRETAFDDTRKALYEELFHSADVRSHVSAFSVNGRMLAGHFGYVWRGVLLLGPPAIRLEDEQRSPAVILLSWIIQNAESMGLKGFDLTIGESDFKKRLGNQCVQLSMLEIHRGAARYQLQVSRDALVGAAKRTMERIAGPDAWNQRVKPAAAWLSYKRARLGEMSVREAVKTAAGQALGAVYDRRIGLVYSITPADLRPVAPVTSSGDVVEIHDDRIEDLLRCSVSSMYTSSLLTHCARTFSRGRATGRTFHTIVVNGRLAGWGYSYLPAEPAQLTETPGATLEFEAGSASLYDFHVLPEWRGRRLYQALLSDIVRKRFAEGVNRAYITVLESNAASRKAIERVGFRLLRRNFYRKNFRKATIRTESAVG
jgi:CelD/BcsL family acetyltransferase involved in cellulose biosynthesis/GNAT superfamily N-acetyltransferase